MTFESHLKSLGKSDNTIVAYLHTIKLFNESFSEINENSIAAFKTFLIDNYHPRTVNLRISAMNAYLKYSGQPIRMSSIRYQQQTYLDNVISLADYECLKNGLLSDENLLWYYIVRFLGSTGSRINELLQFKVEHIRIGYVDIYSKGGKIRRIYIPLLLQIDAMRWLDSIGKYTGPLFVNSKGNILSAKGISSQLKKLAVRYGIDPSVVYPHSFRHMFAKTFMQRYNDIALLADLLGHESIETTRIYLRMSSNEQREIVNQTVDW